MIGESFDQYVFDLLQDELSKHGVQSIVTGFVIVAECDRADGAGSDFIVGFEPSGQKKTVTFGLMDMYASMRRSEEFMIDLVSRTRKEIGDDE